MAYAAVADVEIRLGRSLTTSEAQQVTAWLADAAILIDGYTRYTVVGTAPDAFAVVSANMVIRVLGATDVVPGTESQTDQVGPFSQTLRFGSGGSGGSVWLSSTDKMMLRPWRTGVASVSLMSERYDPADEDES
jgi:hypothetical protein